MSATVKELLKSDSICESYVQMKKGPFFDLQCIASSVNDAASALSTFKSYLVSLHSWIWHNDLALNPIWGNNNWHSPSPQLRPSVIHILSSSVPISDYITALCVTLDSNLILNKHVSSVCKSAYCTIKALHHIRPVLTCDVVMQSCRGIINMTRLDFANSVHIGTS